jgi:hypothetical protein
LLAADDGLQGLAGLPHVPQLRFGALTAEARQPAAGPAGVGEIVGRHTVDDRSAVEEREQEVLVGYRARHLIT